VSASFAGVVWGHQWQPSTRTELQNMLWNKFFSLREQVATPGWRGATFPGNQDRGAPCRVLEPLRPFTMATRTPACPRTLSAWRRRGLLRGPHYGNVRQNRAANLPNPTIGDWQRLGPPSLPPPQRPLTNCIGFCELGNRARSRF